MAKPVSLFERTLVCTRCHDSVVVVELPRRFIEPAEFVCGSCLKPTVVLQQMRLA